MDGDPFPVSEFDDWAAQYDADVANSAFPFTGYADVLRLIFEQAAPRPGMDVLDLGVGTGNLAALFARVGCRVRGLDFSGRMLEMAARKLPGMTLAQGDLRDALPAALAGRYDALVSGYTFHHFPLAQKVEIARRLLEQHARPGAPLLVGDIAFTGAAAQDALRRALGAAWEQEEYWLADEAAAAFAAAGMRLAFTPVSNCAGVLRIRESPCRV